MRRRRNTKTLKDEALNSTGEDKAKALERFKAANRALQELLDDQKHFTSVRSKWRNIEDTLTKALNSETYRRPTRYRAGVPEKVWENAKGPDGIVRDPLTKNPMKFDEPWEMGHKPQHEFWKHQVSAAERGISREQFLDEYNDPNDYRPETPETNSSHAGEDRTSAYKGK